MKKNTIVIYYENGNKEVINFDLSFINKYELDSYESIEKYVKDVLAEGSDSLAVLELPLSQYLEDKFEDYLDNNNIECDWNVVNNYIIKTGKYITGHLGITKIEGNIEVDGFSCSYVWDDDLFEFEDNWLLSLDPDNSEIFRNL